jgi:hypothetical protein
MTLYQGVGTRNLATKEMHEGYAQLTVTKQRCRRVMPPVAKIMSNMEHLKPMEVDEAKKFSKSQRGFVDGREYMQSSPGINLSNS